jgi:uncharacterized protein (DUF1778 family)
MAAAGTISVRLNANERALLDEYAEFVDAPISTLMKRITVEKAEDELDYHTAEKAYRHHLRHPKTFTLDEVISRINGSK